MLYPPKSLPFSRPNDLFRDPSTNFVLPSYVEAQARALTSLPSLPRILSCGYDLGVKKNSMMKHWKMCRIKFLSLGVDPARFMNPLVGPKVQWKALMNFSCLVLKFVYI
jgi:hypothetical protein